MGSRLMAIVAEGQNRRISLSPTPEHEEAATKIIPEWQPDNATLPNTRYTTPAIYGMTTHADLFTPRQLVALTTFNNLVSDARERVLTDIGGGTLDAIAYPNAVATYLGLVSSKSTAFTILWPDGDLTEGKSAHAFGRQAFPTIVWDYAEVNPFAGAGGDFFGIVDGIFITSPGISTNRPTRFCAKCRATPQGSNQIRDQFSLLIRLIMTMFHTPIFPISSMSGCVVALAESIRICSVRCSCLKDLHKK